MKLKSFRIQNYKSIIDSGECRLSDNDNILVLAGQNESGKSSILQALYDYEQGELREDCLRQFDEGRDVTYPVVECTYHVDKDNNWIEEIGIDIPAHVEDVLSKLQEICLIRTFSSEEKSSFSFDIGLTEKIKKAIESFQKKKNTVEEKSSAENENEDVKDDSEKEEISITNISEEVFRIMPKIIYFDDFCDLLPDKILISDLKSENLQANGYNAVKNVERILNADLTELDTFPDAVSASRQDSHNREITANFNERWRQKIFEDNEVKISVKYNQGRSGTASSYLNFFISTKEGEYLTLKQRSKGLIWFLSFWLELQAQSKKTDELIILFDEPGLYLHSKAQGDIKSLLEELAEKNQIIYTTHSPYLIDSDKLNRVRLVINDKRQGTLIEKVTTDRTKGRRDALKPIIDAIGLEIAHDFSVVRQKNVIVEGISDFYYLLAMKKILGIREDLCFVPSMGAQNVHLLMELCMGWGLDWQILLDGGRESNTAYNKIKKRFFEDNDEQARKKIHKITDGEGIEDNFTLSDLRLIEPKMQSEQDVKNSELVKKYGGKELFGRLFAEKVDSSEITKEKVSKKAIGNFEDIFKFVQEGFK